MGTLIGFVLIVLALALPVWVFPWLRRCLAVLGWLLVVLLVFLLMVWVWSRLVRG